MPEPKTGFEALEHELQGENASALGRLGRRLEQALARLREWDATVAAGRPAPRPREQLVGEAAERLWELLAQREAMGIRTNSRLHYWYRIPPEVSARMGPRASRATRTRD